MTEWKKYQLQEVATVQTGPFGSQLHQSDYVEIGTPIITVEHLGENRITHNNLPRVTDKDKQRLNKYWLQEGDIVFSRVGSVDRRAYVKKFEDGWLFSGRCLRVRPKKDIDGKYLSYFFGLEDFKKKIRSVAVGATMPSLNTSIMNEIEVILPDENTQQKIASILSSLDDKIELNLQMNQTLEAMAQVLFKEWFVNFNFPGFDGELVDGLPNGWRIGKLGDIAKVIDCLHSKKPERINEKTGNIFLQLNNILDNGLLDVSEIFWISNEDYKKWISRIEISQGDCVITNVGRVGAVSRIPFGVKAALGRNMTGIRLKEEYPYPGFLITLLKSDMIKMEIEQKKDIGTILEALNVKNIPNLTFPIPTNQVFDEFEIIVSKIWDKMEANTAQSLTLMQIRDGLLPKLMTGKIEIKE